MLLATTCPVCGAAGSAPCAPCAATLRPAPALAPPEGLDACLALLRFEGAGRQLVVRLKYRNHRSAVPGLASAMASLVEGTTGLDVVTWAPTTAARRRDRGFDQAELLARAVASQLRLPARRLLRRGHGPPQTGRALAGRLEGPRFSARRRGWPKGVLLVDDVVTSGTTLSAAARSLRAAGATVVVGLAAAWTPPPPA